MNQMVQFDNFEVASQDGLVSLTGIFDRATGLGIADGKQSPYEWSRRDGQQFIDFVSENLNTAKCRIYKSKRGKGGGTFAHWQIAMAYAKYLSHELHMQVNEAYARFKAADVTLAADIAERADPEKAEWLFRRVSGVVARNQFTKTLASHGVSGGNGFRLCTNAIYLPLFHGTAAEIREKRGLPEKANLREHMSAQELITTAFAEMLATDRVKARAVFGNDGCAMECNRAASDVAGMIRDAREAA